MAFREDLKEWWNDPLEFRKRRFPKASALISKAFRRLTLRYFLWFMVGIGLWEAVMDYILERSSGFLVET
jgi:hypothetical protein